MPHGPPMGARDEQSTYLHLLGCMLEYEALRRVFDAATAHARGWRHDTWVCREVLERPAPLLRVLRARGLLVPEEDRG